MSNFFILMGYNRNCKFIIYYNIFLNKEELKQKKIIEKFIKLFNIRYMIEYIMLNVRIKARKTFLSFSELK